MDQLTFAMMHNQNVILIGPHGCGKTTRITSLWESQGYRNDFLAEKIYCYYNAPTIDVYEDLKGIPINLNGKLVYIQPEHRAWDRVEWILIDEPNRAHLKIVNTLYELIQFKSLNGIKLPKLRGVWAAMNPSGDKYTVDVVDESFLDRFQHRIYVDPELDENFFLKKGLSNKQFQRLVAWWKAIPLDIRLTEAPPRRIEYTIDTFNNGGKINWILSERLDLNTLETILSNPTDIKKFLVDPDEAKIFLDNVNNYVSCAPDEFIGLIQAIPSEVWKSHFPYRNDNKVKDRAKINDFLYAIKNAYGLFENDVLVEVAKACELVAPVLVQLKFLRLSSASERTARELLQKHFPYLVK